MSILVLNAGSSSLRFSLFDDRLNLLDKGHVDAIGHKECQYRHTVKKTEETHSVKIKNHAEAIRFVLKNIDTEDIRKVAHRVVHGGEKYIKTTRITGKVLKDLDRLSSLAPLHNPSNLLTLRACAQQLPKAIHYAVFDTAFHSTLPEKAYLYGLPYSYYKKEGIRRFGFHGSSHQYVSTEAVRILKNRHAKLITCHMGNGISLAAIHNGKVLDTTMGFTPLEGPIMGTRSGTLDPGILFHLLQKTSAEKLRAILEHESGFKGVSGIGSDIRELRAKPKAPGTRRTFELLSYQIAKLIGSLCVPLGGLPDAIVFTAGIGENAYYLRAQIAQELKGLGIQIDASRNKKNAPIISTAKSSVKLLVIPTNEELQMARELGA